MKLYSLKETSEKDVYRIVDLDGNWENYQTPKGIAIGVTNVLHKAAPKDSAFYNYLLNTTKEESQRKLEKGGDEGARVHDAIRDLILGHKLTLKSLYPSDQTGKPEVLNMDEWKALLAWENFAKKFQPEYIHVEKTLWNEKVAGTTDFVGTILLSEGDKISLNGKQVTIKSEVRIKVLLDWKKTKAIYPEYKKQTGVYRELLGDSTVTHTGVLRLGSKHKDGYELALWDTEKSNKHAKLFWNDYEYLMEEYDPFDPEELKTEIPEEIKVSIPKYGAPVKAKKASTAKPKTKKQNVA